MLTSSLVERNMMSDMSMARATMEMETKIHCDGGESVENIRGWLLTHE